MSDNVKIVSPIDGSVYAERALARDAEIESAVTGARAALPAWRSVSVSERARYMLAFLDALLAMNDEIAVELAWQMGRPVRYGGEKGSVEDRVRGMVALAEEALKPYYPPEKPGFRRHIAREPLGVVLVVAPWNYPYLTSVNTIVPGLARRQRRHPQACRPDLARRRAHRRGLQARRTAQGAVRQPGHVA